MNKLGSATRKRVQVAFDRPPSVEQAVLNTQTIQGLGQESLVIARGSSTRE
jgi:hypothetical protein